MDCPFCNINHLVTRIIKEKKNEIIFLSNPRVAPGHILIAPRKHVLRLGQLTRDEWRSLFDLAIEYQEKITLNVAPGCDMKQSYRPYIPQNSIITDHAHLHLIPRRPNDGLAKLGTGELSLFKSLEESERNKFLEIYSG